MERNQLPAPVPDAPPRRSIRPDLPHSRQKRPPPSVVPTRDRAPLPVTRASRPPSSSPSTAVPPRRAESHSGVQVVVEEDAWWRREQGGLEVVFFTQEGRGRSAEEPVHQRDGERRWWRRRWSCDIGGDLLGTPWSLIASHLPGRTDNEIKNYWNSHLSRQIHTFRRTYAAGNDTTITIDISKLSAAGKRRGGRTPGQSPRKKPAKTKEVVSSPAVATSSASSPPQSDGARSVVVDPDQNQPNNSVSHTFDGPCSEDETWPVVMEPVDQTGLLEANSRVDQAGLWEEDGEMEALLCSGVRLESGLTDMVSEGPAAQVDDLLDMDMDWEGFASHLWGAPAQNDAALAAEPQAAATTGSAHSEELESFVSWLLSDAS